MVSVELTGGLGNQMFQYAFALAEADGAELIAYHSDVPGTTPRAFELGHFGVKQGSAPLDCDHEQVIAIGRDGYESVVVGCGEDVHIRGMWMGEGPWKEREAEVSGLFLRPGKTIEAIAMHVRRTDFIGPRSPMVELGADYYRRALERVPRGMPVLVFTDAPDWARQNVPGILIDEPDQYRAMWLMSRCRHHVIANSSFSWWAAWLGEKGRVVAPSRWLKNNDAVTTQIVPERWATV